MSDPTAAITVDSRGGADFRTISAAVDAAAAGARIVVRPGTFDELVRIVRDVEIIADGPPGAVAIRGSEGCIAINGGSVALRGLTIRQGVEKPGRLNRLVGRGNTTEAPSPTTTVPHGSAISIGGGQLAVEDCVISAATGIGIAAKGSGVTVTVRRSYLHRIAGGTMVLDGASASIHDTEFSEWSFDAVWGKGPVSRVEIIDCRFHDGAGQAIFLDGAATGIVEGCSVDGTNAGVFVDGRDTEALVRASTFARCATVGVGIVAGARAVLDGSTVTDGILGFNAVGAGTKVEIQGGHVATENGVGATDGSNVSVAGVELDCARAATVAAGEGTVISVHDCHLRGMARAGVEVLAGGVIRVEGGEISASNIGILATDAGTSVDVRGVRVHGSAGPGISIGAGVKATVEGCDVFDNAFPGIVSVGGVASIIANKVHDNRSNGIAIREGADAKVERNEVWANEQPAITIVGRGTFGRIRENIVRDQPGQGIYAFGGADAVIAENRLADNGGAAITVSDPGTSANVSGNRIEGGGVGIWVADGAKAKLTANEITGSRAPGIHVGNGGVVEAADNVVSGATCGVMLETGGGTFLRNHLVGNAGGSWVILDAPALTRTDNEEDALAVPGWASVVLDPAKYPIFAYRVADLLGVPPSKVAELASALSLAPLARSLDQAPVPDWQPLIEEHFAAEGQAHRKARAAADIESADPAEIRAHLVAHLEVGALVDPERPSRPSPISGIVEVLSVHEPTGAGSPLGSSAGLGGLDDLFALGEAHARAGLKVTELVGPLLGTRAFTIEGAYSGSAALMHLTEWCPEVVGTYGALVLAGNAERLIVVPVEDSSIIYALPRLVGVAGGAWGQASWRLRPVLAWMSPDRVDLFEIEVGPKDTIAAVRSPDALAMLLARLPEPADRIPAGWETEAALTRAQSLRLLPIVRLELLRRMNDDVAQIAAISPRTFVELAMTVRDRPEETWSDEIHAFFDATVRERGVLDHLTGRAPYEEVRPHLWIKLDKTGSGAPITQPVVDGVVAELVLVSGRRTRYVVRSLVASWAMTEAQIWDDAAMNVREAKVVEEPFNGPVRKFAIEEAEGEAVGLQLHRLPGACPNGYLLGLIHKGAAYALSLDDAAAVANIGRFGGLMASIFEQAAAFNDELSSHVLWLQPDGIVVDLFDARTGPKGNPPGDFQALVRRLTAQAGRLP